MLRVEPLSILFASTHLQWVESRDLENDGRLVTELRRHRRDNSGQFLSKQREILSKRSPRHPKRFRLFLAKIRSTAARRRCFRISLSMARHDFRTSTQNPENPGTVTGNKG